MDVPREGAQKRRILRRAAIGVVVVAIVLAAAWSYSTMKPAAPSVEKATLLIDTVKRGPLTRQVRGLGTLVPEEVLWIPAVNDGRVEKVAIRPGASVSPQTVVVVLENRDLALAAEDLRWQVKAAEANLADLRAKLETARLDLRSAVARVESEYVQAKLKWERDEALLKEGLTPDLTVKLSKATADELAKRFEIDKTRLAISTQSEKAQMDAQRVQIEKLQAAYKLKRQQVEELTVRAGTSGVLQQMPVEVGQRVTPGTILAKIAQPSHLKAEIKIPETQAKDVALGQLAEVDTRNGIIRGKVVRIDPAAVNGNVTVDVSLIGALPAGARPDLSVEGVIELERLSDVVYMQRPVSGQPGSVISLFKVSLGDKEAMRVMVKTGRASAQAVEILDGLRAGDRVILSDMSAWEGHDRLQLQ